MKNSKKQRKAHFSKSSENKEREAYEYTLAFFLLIFPIIYIPFLRDQFESPRIFLAFLFTSLAWFLFLLKEKQISLDAVSITALAFSISFLAVSLAGRYIGFFTLSDIFGSFDFPMSPVFILTSAFLLVLLRQLKDSFFFLRLFLYSSGFAGFIAGLQHFLLKNSSVFNGRSYLPAGNPVYLGGFLAISFALLLSSKLKSAERLVLLVLILFGIVASGTRVSLLAVFFSLLFYLLLSTEKGKTAAAFAGFSLLAISAFLNYGRIKELYSEFLKRLDLYKAALQGFFAAPFSGNGLSGFERYFRKLSVSRSYLNNVGEVPHSSHSALLDFLFGGGTVPLLFFLSLIIFVLIENVFFGLASLIVLLFTPVQPYVWMAFSVGSGLIEKRFKSTKIKIAGTLKYLLLTFALFSLVLSGYSAYKVFFANYYYEQFFNRMHAGNLTEASEFLDKAIKLLPYENRLLFEKAVFYSKIYGDESKGTDYFKTALRAIERAQENNPYSFEAAILKSDILVALGDLGKKSAYEEAVSAAKVAIYLSPYDARGYYQLGLAHAGLNEIDKAVDVWKKAIRLKPNYVDAYYGLGYAYQLKKDKNQALKFYNLAKKFASQKELPIIEEAIKQVKENLK